MILYLGEQISFTYSSKLSWLFFSLLFDINSIISLLISKNYDTVLIKIAISYRLI